MMIMDQIITVIELSLSRDKMMRDAELIEAMDQISRVGGVAVVHAENGDIVAEVIIINNEYTPCHNHPDHL